MTSQDHDSLNNDSGSGTFIHDSTFSHSRGGMMNSTKIREIERIYQKTLQEYRMHAREAPEVYNLKLSTALDSLGTFYSDVKEFEKAEKAYTEALQIRRGLFENRSYINAHELNKS